MKISKEQWSNRFRRSLETKRQAQEEAKALLTRLQYELDTKGYYTLAQ